MNRLASFYAALLLAGLVIPLSNLNSQDNDQMVQMVRSMLTQFGEFVPDDRDMDEVIPESAAFDPDTDLSNKALYEAILEGQSPGFKLTEYQNGYTILDGKEYPTNSINLVFSYTSLPAFTLVNLWYELDRFEDERGKDLGLSEKDLNTYREYGIIDDGYNFPVPGEFSTQQWMDRELEPGQKVGVKGSLFIEYPSEYQQVNFAKGDLGASVKIGDIEITLISIDRNMATLRMKGNRQKIEGLHMLILNKEGKLFGGQSSMGIDAEMFDMETGMLKEISDEEIAASVNNFDMSNMEIDQVKKIKVFGNIASLVFLKIDSYNSLEVPFDQLVEFTGYF